MADFLFSSKGARTRRVARRAVRQRGEVLCSHQSFIKSAEWRIFCCGIQSKGVRTRRVTYQVPLYDGVASRGKFPSAEGCREAAGWSNPHSPYCGQHTPVTRTRQCPPPPGPAQTKFAWADSGAGVGLIRAPLSLRRSAINVENVVVRLRQSSAICLRANARSAFLFTGSPRSARDDKGD